MNRPLTNTQLEQFDTEGYVVIPDVFTPEALEPVYFAKVGEVIVVLLAGGDKSSQQKDIQRAIALWEENKDDADRFHEDY